MQNGSDSATPQAHRPDARRQPRGLYVLCATVGFERFSFFLFSAILVLYLNERIGLPGARAVAIYGSFLCGSYLTPLLGGRLCDGRLGCRRTALLGCALQAVGYGAFFSERIAVLYGALLLMAFGSGLFKAGTQTLLGNLYGFDDPRRERGFGAFYAAVNVGGLAAPMLGGLIRGPARWSVSFALTSIGAALGVCVLALGRVPVFHAGAADTKQAGRGPGRAVPLPTARRQLALVLAAGVVFAIGFVQSHSSLLLWARDRTERHLGRFEIPVAWFAAAPAALVLLLAPLLSLGFGALHRRCGDVSALRKISLGLLLSGLAFVPLWLASLLSPRGQRTSPLWVLGCLALLAMGELLVSALAPSEISRIAPVERRGRWIGYWFVALAAGTVLGGWVRF